MEVDDLVEVGHRCNEGVSADLVGFHIEGPNCNEVVVFGFLIMSFDWGTVVVNRGLSLKETIEEASRDVDPCREVCLLGDESSDLLDEGLDMGAGIL